MKSRTQKEIEEWLTGHGYSFRVVKATFGKTVCIVRKEGRELTAEFRVYVEDVPGYMTRFDEVFDRDSRKTLLARSEDS